MWKKRLRKLWWRIFGWPDTPPPFKIKARTNAYTGKLYYSKADLMANKYINGLTIQEIAKFYNVTRERVRQCIWKSWRDNEKY
jgi:predicted DNA-binding protein YlxM (UPF0122 family)